MSDLDDEIRSHFEHGIDDNMTRGMTWYPVEKEDVILPCDPGGRELP